VPYVNLKVAGKLDRNQKEQIIKEFSETLFKVAKKPKETITIVIDEVEKGNWAKGDSLLG